MKYFKYIALLLLLAVTMGSCEKKDVGFMAEPVDEGQMAYVQICYYAPISTAASNNIYFVDLNGVEYGNDGASFLTTYNAVPSGGVNLYYAVKAGPLNVRLHKRESDANGNYVYPVAYDQSVNIEAGKRYGVFIHDMNQPPIAIEMQPVPKFGKALDTDSLCRVQFVNVFYENGEPIKDKVQYGVQNLYTKEYEPVGEPVAFGEVTSWFMPVIHKTDYNSAGSQRREVCLFRVDPQTNQIKERMFDDWWTWAIGRAYRQIGAGNVGGSPALTLKQFVIQ